MPKGPTPPKGNATRRSAKPTAGSRTSGGRNQPARGATTGRSIPGLDLARSIRFNVYNLVVVALIGLGLLTLTPYVQQWVYQQQQVLAVAAEVERAKQKLADMKVERQRWDDPVYVRSQARDRLYYVMPGEVSYLVMDADGIDPNDTSGTVGAQMAAKRNTTEITKEIRVTKDNWVDSLLYTVVHAGTDEPAE
ncbi:MAG: hypothetical protein RL118_853 [Actinomycetota bacterium]